MEFNKSSVVDTKLDAKLYFRKGCLRIIKISTTLGKDNYILDILCLVLGFIEDYLLFLAQK